MQLLLSRNKIFCPRTKGQQDRETFLYRHESGFHLHISVYLFIYQLYTQSIDQLSIAILVTKRARSGSATAVVAVSACYSCSSYVRGPRIDVDLCVSTYSTLKSSSILGAPYMAEGLKPDDTGMGQQCAFQAGPGAIQTKVNDKPS